MITVGVGFLIFFLDQVSKLGINHWLENQMQLSVIPGCFNLTLVYNTGAAFGIFKDQRWLLMVLAILCMFFVFYAFKLYGQKNTYMAMALGLILGGALGNFVDRIRLGYVIDFLDFYISSHHWPAFNIADTAICVGVGLMMLRLSRAS